MDTKEKQKMLLRLWEIEYIMFWLSSAQYVKFRNLATEKWNIISKLSNEEKKDIIEIKKKDMARRYLESKNKKDVQ